jgi:hypothetical protein
LNPVLEDFVRDTRNEYGDPPSGWRAALSRPAAEDWLDAAVLGGVALKDVLAGRVSDGDIDPRVIEAFHTQYPRVAGSFVDFVRSHQSPEEIQGIVSGVKGKVLEFLYVDYLNHGHLPAGQVAELAQSATQPGWDIAVHDQGGHLVDTVQVKATDSIEYIKHALERYPHVDIATTHEVFDAIHDPAVHQHLVDSGFVNHALETKVQLATDAASAGLHYHLPMFAFAFIAAQLGWSLWKGRCDLRTAAKTGADRGLKAGVVSVVAWGAKLLAGPFAAIPAAVVTRLLMSRKQVGDEDQQAHDASLSRIRAITARFNADDRRALPPAPAIALLGPMEAS